MKTPIELIIEERIRQQEKEGWTAEHDDEHKDGSLAMAAALYASPSDHLMDVTGKDPWPWVENITQELDRGNRTKTIHVWDSRKKFDRMRRLQVAGALIVAEMERLQRIIQPVSN